MIRLGSAPLVATVALLTAAAAAGGQTCTTPSSGSTATRKCTVAVSSGTWAVAKLGVLTLNSNATISLASPDGSTYDAGYRIELPALARTATVQANAPWSLSVAPSAANSCVAGVCWTAVALPPPSPTVAANTKKPADEFLVATAYDASGATYFQLPDANTPGGSTTLLSAQAATAGHPVSLYWAEIWNYFADTPGTYTIPFVVTLTIP